MRRVILGLVLCIAAFSQADARTVVLQPQPAPGYYPAPPGYYPPPPPRRGYYAPQRKPMGWGAPYPAVYGYRGLECSHRNYQPINGWCQRVW